MWRGRSAWNLIGWLSLDPEVKVERIDKMLHGCLADTSHVFAAFAGLFVVHDLELALQGRNLLHVRLACVLGGDINHYHKYGDEHRKPVLGEKVD